MATGSAATPHPSADALDDVRVGEVVVHAGQQEDGDLSLPWSAKGRSGTRSSIRSSSCTSPPE
ncbi:hypothetical protein V1L54_21630, partial [Streptomyces sp. TRM 70361]|uniref:hypothetical protein n=1 Tax=Streptomyces sp. TRM 70361 TaxID=3116553 RepID=UPI002E7BA32B